MMTPTVLSTIELITRLHEGQVDKTGAPYVNHPLAVAGILMDDEEFRNTFYVSPEIQQDVVLIALLHDVLEDTPTTVRDLYDLDYPKRVVEAVELLTKRKGDTYVEFIDKVIQSNSTRAILVKLADITHNMAADRLESLDDATKARLLKKYQPAYKALVEALQQCFNPTYLFR